MQVLCMTIVIPCLNVLNRPFLWAVKTTERESHIALRHKYFQIIHTLYWGHRGVEANTCMQGRGWLAEESISFQYKKEWKTVRSVIIVIYVKCIEIKLQCQKSRGVY